MVTRYYYLVMVWQAIILETCNSPIISFTACCSTFLFANRTELEGYGRIVELLYSYYVCRAIAEHRL